MSRWIVVCTAILACAALLMGCSSGGGPVIPSNSRVTSQGTDNPAARSQTHLWGYYDVYVDLSSRTAVAILDRHAMFTANVVNFINSKAAALAFTINSTAAGPDYVDVDIDVAITHPFPGMAMYNGYDVRGIFMGNGSGSLNYNPGLIYPVAGTDQFMTPDPVDGFGGPDGYSRWFNRTEFSEGGMPLLSYTPGKYATKGYSPTATLCPYKYFADSLGATDDLWTWLEAHGSQHGVFFSGVTNDRNYYLRFPNAQGVKYAYAIIANWEGEAPENHPSNAPEAVACEVVDHSDLYFVSPSLKGGNIDFDISLWDWDSKVSGGVMQDYRIYIESTVLSSIYQFSMSDMTPIGGGEHFSTYHVDISADNLTGAEGNECWIIAECADETYANNMGVPNLAQDDPLAALFRYDLHVDTEIGNLDPICDLDVVTPMPKSGFGPQTVEFNASASHDPEGKALTFEWDFDNDGTFGDPFNSGTPAHPFKAFNEPNNDQVCVRVSDPDGGSSECCAPVDINPAQSKNLPLRSDMVANDLAVDPNNGNLLILYDDGQVWKYTASGFYSQSSATLLFTANIPVTPYNPVARIANYRIDIASSGNMIASGYAGSNGWPAGSWDSNGSKIDNAPAPGAGDSVPDVFAFPAGGAYGNSHVFLCPGNGGNQNNLYRNYYGGGTWQQHYETAGENQSIGYQYVKFSQAVGAVAVSGSQYWVIEDTPDYYASKWLLSGWYHSFDGEWFGTGSQTDADDGWYEAKDITMDSSNRFYVLDKLSSGQGRIKVFTSGSPGAADTAHAAGDASTISESPLRIEGTSYVSPSLGNLIFVLHGNGIPSKLSVFFPSDFGW